MSKELEAFNEIIDKFAEQMMRANKEALTAINKTNAIEYLYRTPQVILLQQTLQRLEAIDNSKPNEALEDLKELHELAYGNEETSWKIDEIRMSSHIKQALLRLDSLDAAMDLLPNRFSCIKNREIIVMRTEMYEKYQEQEKALSIIKEYRIDIELLMNCTTLDEYCYYCSKSQLIPLPQEFDLLKRYFK